MTATQGSAATTFTTIFGTSASLTINSSDPSTPTLHNWVADSKDLYQTSTNLADEWLGYYTTMQNGGASSLNDIQRLEGNAEALFLNTGLNNLGSAQQAIDREDVQREYDAIYAAMQLDHFSLDAPLTEQEYLQIGYTIQNNATLDELAMQGHGLNNSCVARYAGYTTDFQNNVDNATLFIGGGTLNQNNEAIAQWFDDNGLSHILFPVIWQNGHLEQLNQNGAGENRLDRAIVAFNDSMCYRVYTSADFSTSPATKQSNAATNAAYWNSFDKTQLAAIDAQISAPAPTGEVTTLFGADVANTVTFNLGNGITHTWTANANGLYTTTADLATEWYNAYVTFTTVGGGSLTAEQKLEANAEAAFLNSGLSGLGAAQQAIDRMDVQRQLDAMFAALQQDGINPSSGLTAAQYLQMQRTIESSPLLEELAIQGHGLEDPTSPNYDGMCNDFQFTVNNTTLFEGGGPANGRSALGAFLPLDITTYCEDPVVVIDGVLRQLNQNGEPVIDLVTAVAGFDRAMKQAYNSSDFGT